MGPGKHPGLCVRQGLPIGVAMGIPGEIALQLGAGYGNFMRFARVPPALNSEVKARDMGANQHRWAIFLVRGKRPQFSLMPRAKCTPGRECDREFEY